MHNYFMGFAQIIDLLLGICYSKIVKYDSLYERIFVSDLSFLSIYRSILFHWFCNEQIGHSSAAGLGNQTPYHTFASESADQIPEDHSEAETLPQICGDTPCVPDGRHTHIESADRTDQTTPDGIAALCSMHTSRTGCPAGLIQDQPLYIPAQPGWQGSGKKNRSDTCAQQTRRSERFLLL